MSVWCSSKEEFVALSEGPLAQIRSLCEPGLLARETIDGYCVFCQAQTTFDVGAEPTGGEWKNLREGLLCRCGMNARMRMTVRVLEEVLTRIDVRRAAVLERLTPLFPHLAARVPGLIGCEFLGPDVPLGATVDLHGRQTRNENMHALSFADGSLDLLMHFDVLEHVPDASLGLREARRVLADDGLMMFTCPFFHELDHDIVRARLLPDGSVEHLMQKAYHGNPLTDEGSLVYIHPSLELFDRLADAGFGRVHAVIRYDPLEGIVSNGSPYPDGHMWPITFVAGT